MKPVKATRDFPGYNNEGTWRRGDVKKVKDPRAKELIDSGFCVAVSTSFKKRETKKDDESIKEPSI